MATILYLVIQVPATLEEGLFPLDKKNQTEAEQDHATIGQAKGETRRPARSCELASPSSEPIQSLMPLMTVEPNGINPIDNEEWVEIDVAVDSGATETVMGKKRWQVSSTSRKAQRVKGAWSMRWQTESRFQT